MAAVDASNRRGGPRFPSARNRPSSSVRLRETNKQQERFQQSNKNGRSGQITKRVTQQMAPPSPVPGKRNGDSDSDVELVIENDNVVYQGVIRELGVIKGRVNKVLEDFNTTCMQVEDIPDDFTEESQLSVNKLMDGYTELHSHADRLTSENIELLTEDTPTNEQMFLKDLQDLSDEEFMKAYNLTYEDLLKLKSINFRMVDMATEMRSFAEEAALQTAKSGNPTGSLDDSRYDKMFSMFTEESMKSIRMTSELENHRKDVTKLKDENKHLTEQKIIEEERADQSTKKLVKAEKELRALHREVEYLTILTKRVKNDGRDDEITTPIVYQSSEGQSPTIPSSPLASATHSSTSSAQSKLSAMEVKVEMEEIRKLTPEEQIKRLERLLEKTAFIEKEPVDNSKVPVKKAPEENKKSPFAPQEVVVNKKKPKKKRRPLPFQKVSARKAAKPPVRAAMPCNVTTPNIDFLSPTSKVNRFPSQLATQKQLETTDVRPESPLFKVVMPNWVRRMHHLTTKSSPTVRQDKINKTSSLDRNLKSAYSEREKEGSTLNALSRLMKKWKSSPVLEDPDTDYSPLRLPHIESSSFDSSLEKIRRRPLGQFSSSNSDAVRGAAQFASHKLPGLSYTIRNFTHRVEQQSTCDQDDDFSRLPAETLYKAIVGPGLFDALKPT